MPAFLTRTARASTITSMAVLDSQYHYLQMSKTLRHVVEAFDYLGRDLSGLHMKLHLYLYIDMTPWRPSLKEILHMPAIRSKIPAAYRRSEGHM